MHRVPAATPWSQVLAYSRAVRQGDLVMVSGTLPVDAQGQVMGGDSAYGQAHAVLARLMEALQALGGEARHVMRLRIYLRDYADIGEIARAQREVFGDCPPACTTVCMPFVREDLRVQMELDAVVGED